MGLLVQGAGGAWIDSRAEDIDARLRWGDPGIGWRGDQRLELRLGRVTDQYGNVRTDPRSGQRLERYEVWRDCSDLGVKQHDEHGQWRRIGKWELNEIDNILRDMISMDPRTRGAKTPDQKLDEMFAEEDRAQNEAFDKALAPMLEHALALERDMDTRHFFGQMGGEGKMTRQRRRAEERAVDKIIGTKKTKKKKVRA